VVTRQSLGRQWILLFLVDLFFFFSLGPSLHQVEIKEEVEVLRRNWDERWVV